MNIQSTNITQVYLTRFGEIPFNKLMHRRYLDQLIKVFQFSQAEVAQIDGGNSAILCVHGIHKNDNGEQIINKLELQDRKLIIQVDGSSEDANEAFAILTDFLADLAKQTNGSYLEPIVKAEESRIAAHLDFSFGALLSPTYLSFVESTVVNKASSDVVEAAISPASLRFRLTYLVKDHSLSDYKIGLSPKEFALEPKQGFPLSDQIFYSKAPFDTNTHIRLLEELENTILQNKE